MYFLIKNKLYSCKILYKKKNQVKNVVTSDFNFFVKIDFILKSFQTDVLYCIIKFFCLKYRLDGFKKF